MREAAAGSPRRVTAGRLRLCSLILYICMHACITVQIQIQLSWEVPTTLAAAGGSSITGFCVRYQARSCALALPPSLSFSPSLFLSPPLPNSLMHALAFCLTLLLPPSLPPSGHCRGEGPGRFSSGFDHCITNRSFCRFGSLAILTTPAILTTSAGAQDQVDCKTCAVESDSICTSISGARKATARTGAREREGGGERERERERGGE